VPEGRMLFPYMTVEENLIIGAYSSKECWEKRFEMLEYVYEIFPVLKKYRNKQARLLSGGEQQMATIGRGLMARPKLLMIDEPSLGLAPIVVAEVYKVLDSVHKEGVAILLSEQNAHMALSVAERGYVLENGKIMLHGSAGDLLKNPKVKKAYLGI